MKLKISPGMKQELVRIAKIAFAASVQAVVGEVKPLIEAARQRREERKMPKKGVLRRLFNRSKPTSKKKEVIDAKYKHISR